MKISLKLAFAATALAAAVSASAFQASMSTSALDTEVRQRLALGETLRVIADAGKSANVEPAAFTLAILQNGISGETAVSTLVEAGIAVCQVVAAATSAGQDRLTMVKAAIQGGADPGATCLLDPTAAGDVGPGTSFGDSRDSSSGGGGNKSVSPS
jgi:hypothetical protein